MRKHPFRQWFSAFLELWSEGVAGHAGEGDGTGVTVGPTASVMLRILENPYSVRAMTAKAM